MRYQAGTAVPKLELGNERNEEMCWFPSTSLGTQSSKLQLQRYRESHSTSDPHGARIEGAGTGRDALPSRDSRSQAGAWERAERGDVLVPKLQLGNPALEAPASRIKGKPEHFGPSRSENRGRGNVTGCVTKQGQPFPSWSLGTSGATGCAGRASLCWFPSSSLGTPA